jgi:ubiquinol-cytochrome c reductase cytochrome c1 subunit
VKAIANQWSTEVPSVNPETGEPATRKAIPSDKFPSPYANETAGRAANNNALPPDLSLMAKARHGGSAYIYSILTGYQNQPAELVKKFPGAKTPPGLHYNPYFANLNIAMPPPLTADGGGLADGAPPTVDQMAKDVAAFLQWPPSPTCRAVADRQHRAGVPDHRHHPGLYELSKHLGRGEAQLRPRVRWSPQGQASGRARRLV